MDPEEGTVELQIMMEKPYLIIIVQAYVVTLKTFLEIYFCDTKDIRTHNHLVRKRTLNHLAKLAKWLGCVVSTYLYSAFDCMLLIYHVRVSEWIWIHSETRAWHDNNIPIFFMSISKLILRGVLMRQKCYLISDFNVNLISRNKILLRTHRPDSCSHIYTVN